MSCVFQLLATCKRVGSLSKFKTCRQLAMLQITETGHTGLDLFLQQAISKKTTEVRLPRHLFFLLFFLRFFNLQCGFLDARHLSKFFLEFPKSAKKPRCSSIKHTGVDQGFGISTSIFSSVAKPGKQSVWLQIYFLSFSDFLNGGETYQAFSEHVLFSMTVSQTQRSNILGHWTSWQAAWRQRAGTM